jgi:GNAT superfamily N-acetyltransferase
VESKGNIEIRDAQESDLDAMQEVTLAAYEEYAAVMPAFAWEEYRQGMIDATAGKGPAYQKIVATRDGAIVGSVLLLPAGTVLQLPDGMEITLELPEIRLLAVPPKMRGQGIGAALMKECVRRARQVGVSALSLHTADMMQVAMQMYERMGFVRTPETDFHPAPEVVIKGYLLDLSA